MIQTNTNPRVWSLPCSAVPVTRKQFTSLPSRTRALQNQAWPRWVYLVPTLWEPMWTPCGVWFSSPFSMRAHMCTPLSEMKSPCCGVYEWNLSQVHLHCGGKLSENLLKCFWTLVMTKCSRVYCITSNTHFMPTICQSASS